MTRRGTLCLLAVLACGVAIHSQGSTLAIVNVNVIDVERGRILENQTVVVRGDTIANIAGNGSVPTSSRVVQGSGKYVMPGLWDMHSHNEASGVESLPLFIANGVVGTRDMGSNASLILSIRDRIRTGQLQGPDMIVAGPILDAAPPDWPFRRGVANAEEGRVAVRELKQRGVDFIKVHNLTPRDAFFAIIEEARSVNLPVAGHIPLKVSVDEGVAANMKSIEHFSESRLFRECPGREAYSAERCQSLFDRIVKNQIWQTPTGAFYEQILEFFGGGAVLHAEYVSRGVRELNRKQAEIFKPDDKVLGILRAQRPDRRAAVRDLFTSGAQFLAGCDGWVPGFCLHDELQWLNGAGLSPLQAIQTATINPARFLGRDKAQGVVATGKRADLVLLDANPLTDINNTRRIHAVVVAGRFIDRTALDRMLDDVKAAVVKE